MICNLLKKIKHTQGSDCAWFNDLIFNKGDMMNKDLPLIDIFKDNPSIVAKNRRATLEEYSQSGKIFVPIETIVLHNYEKAILCAFQTLSTNQIETLVENILKENKEFKQWRNCMPSKIPNALSKYQNSYRKCDFQKVDEEINNIGYKLSAGQQLIHGGLWSDLSAKTPTNRPLSTTFCPKVAIVETLHFGKAYDNNRIDIIILTVVNPNTNVYVFNQSRGGLKHEKEVLFASGATLTKKNEIQIEEKYLVHKYDTNLGELKKTVPVYIIEADIS